MQHMTQGGKCQKNIYSAPYASYTYHTRTARAIRICDNSYAYVKREKPVKILDHVSYMYAARYHMTICV